MGLGLVVIPRVVAKSIGRPEIAVIDIGYE
jgi:hypothetical protein